MESTSRLGRALSSEPLAPAGSRPPRPQGFQGHRMGQRWGRARSQGRGLEIEIEAAKPEVPDKAGHSWLALSKHHSLCVKNIVLPQIDSECVSRFY